MIDDAQEDSDFWRAVAGKPLVGHALDHILFDSGASQLLVFVFHNSIDFIDLYVGWDIKTENNSIISS